MFRTPEYTYEWLWQCCNCQGHAGMSVDSTLACVGCGVYRCQNCSLESVRRRMGNKSYQFDTQFARRKEPQPNSRTNSPASLTGSPASSSISQVFTPGLNSAESSSEVELDEIESHDAPHDNTRVSYEDHAFHVLEARLRALLDDDLSLMAQVVPKVFYATRASLRSENERNLGIVPSSSTPQADSGGRSSSTYPSSSQAHESRKRAAPSTPLFRKRSRGSDDSDEARTPDESPRGGCKQLKILSGEKVLKFACHYHKLDPTAHDIRVHRKYKNCPAPSVKVGELRRIKYVLVLKRCI